MADKYDASKIVTKFLLNTCRLPMRLTIRDVEASVYCCLIANGHPADDEEAKYFPFVTGSVAEFYIEPMLPYAGDVDMMFHRNYELAIPEGRPPPTQLPAEFHNYVYLSEIIDSHLPSYVYLRLRYLLSQCIDDGKYSYIEYERPFGFLMNHTYECDKTQLHGPAVLTSNPSPLLSVDAVLCVRCLIWPSQATDWPIRQRNYNWPDSATLDCVVSNGCDLVGVAHRHCKQHEFMGDCQYRLSFSRAEIVLINSWMPVQQIVYHLSRYFIKMERLTDCADNSGASTLSNYHIKTLMLWACELKSRSWWTDNLNLVRICVELLQTLSVWLTDTRCPHYFVNNCNLLDNSFNVKNTASKLIQVGEEYLATWIMNNYLRQCIRQCQIYILQFGDDLDANITLQIAASEVVRWRLRTLPYDLWRAVDFAQLYISMHVSMFSLTGHSCVYWTKELAKVDKRFCISFSAVALLHVACKISRSGITDKLLDILLAIRSHDSSLGFNDLPLHKTEMSTSEVVEVLQKSAVERLTAFRELEAKDFASVVTIVTTDLEALYDYKRGDYRRCLQLSTRNVHTLLYAVRMPSVPIYPEFIQLLDDDFISLTALTVIVHPECRHRAVYTLISQLTLSLYLMTQCQLKLRHSVTSLAQTLEYIKIAQMKVPRKHILDHLTLKLTERKVGLQKEGMGNRSRWTRFT